MGIEVSQKCWVVAVEMGYGHQRAAFALQSLAKEKRIIDAGQYSGIPESDRRIWHESRLLYETISQFKDVPVLGGLVFSVFDKFQEIKDFYPKNQGIEPPTLQLKQIYGFIEKRNLGKHLIKQLNREPLPLIATFPAVAFMAEYWGYQGTIWLVVTDTDISRAWAPLNPAKTRIRYCVPTVTAAQRLQQYGILKHNIFFTGFPLPDQLTLHAKEDVAKRLRVLDPEQRYLKLYADLVKRYVGEIPVKPKKIPPVSLTFAVGGAGAQQEIGKHIMRSLAPLLLQGKVRLNLIAGTHQNIANDFTRAAKEFRLSKLFNENLCIIFAKTKPEYFKLFNQTMRKTDILWTKPSELVFYCALGIPLILSPPLGSQEIENRKWLLSVGAGIDEIDSKLTRQWILDFLLSGNLAEAAMQGFVEVEREGVGNIAKFITNQQ